MGKSVGEPKRTELTAITGKQKGEVFYFGDSMYSSTSPAWHFRSQELVFFLQAQSDRKLEAQGARTLGEKKVKVQRQSPENP